MVPVSVRPEEARADMGGEGVVVVHVARHRRRGPRGPARAIHEGMLGAKEQHRAIGAETLTDWAEFAAPAVFGRAMRLYARMGLADRHRPIFNVTISNVPGPPFALYSAGAKLEANFPLGPIFDGAALNITVMSLEDSLDFGILTCPDVVDDVWALADGLQASLDELLAVIEAAAAKAAAPAVKPKRKPVAKKPTPKPATSKPASGPSRGAAPPHTRRWPRLPVPP
ncbi:MAG: WS/DGAT domain-containing protein [Acidimicrobiales bacterium]